MQQSFFDPQSRIVVEGEQGSVSYFPGRICMSDGDRWFSQLRDTVVWKSERRMMYQREVDVPRLVARLSLDDNDVPAAVREASAVARQLADCDFSSAGLNYYRNGQDSVAPHNDKVHDLQPGAPIAIVSLGAARIMTIRSKTAPRRTLRLELEHASILVMSYNTQLHYDHGIPKVKGEVGPRISLAFRRRRQAAEH
jgi:alkylated DNA repair dioxygenase AlkB